MRKTFGELINNVEPTLVDFYADWCGPCKQMKPILKDLKTRIGEKATIVTIDVDNNQKVAQQFGVQSVPTLILFQKGKVIWRQSGVVTASGLEQILQPYLTT